ncbi:MAG: hypothetical protein IB618_01775 [Candidatus Pacearchaeota archaeon]|nr:MAG: hypothetical protein IB618_01775 [Candidatus Pacearchaeota archaeon]
MEEKISYKITKWVEKILFKFYSIFYEKDIKRKDENTEIKIEDIKKDFNNLYIPKDQIRKYQNL